METLQIALRNSGVRQLLQNLAEMKLIEIVSVGGQTASPLEFNQQPEWEKEEFEDRETDPKKFVRHAGWGKGTFIIHPSFYEPLEEFRKYE